MRIVYLHQYFKTPQQNGGTFSYEMARQLVARGHQVHMVTADCTGVGRRSWNCTNKDGIMVHRYPVAYSNHFSYRRRIEAFLRFACVAGRKAAALPGDLVYASSTPLTIALPAVYAARRRSIPMVFEVADLWPEIPIAMGALKGHPAIAAARWLERFAYRNAAHVVAFSPGMKAGVVATGYPSHQVTVIPNGCDVGLFSVPRQAGQEFRRRHAWLQSRPLVVYTGALGRVNGVGYLARLAAEVRRRDPEICFLVVGTGCEEGEIRQQANQLGVLDQNFFMHPPIPKTEMPAILSAADIATSVVRDVKELWNNSANKVFDAMAAGRPIAINHQGWFADLIRQTGCGLVLDARDVLAAADQLVSAIRDRQWLRQAGAAANCLGRQRFDRRRLIDRWESVLLSVCGARQQRAAA